MNLHFHAAPAGKGTLATVTARRHGEEGPVLHVERFDLARSPARRKFAAAVLDALGKDADHLTAAQVEEKLLAIAAELSTPVKPVSSVDPVEVGDGRVVRPERFILAGVSGLAVPRRVIRAGRPAHEWQLFRRWSDGGRETVDMQDAFEVDGTQVFIDPLPDSPPQSMAPGWSAEGREAWLDGEPTMLPRQLCKLLREAFDKYLDLPEETGPGTVALLSVWTVLSYVFQVFEAVPYLAVSGPAGSGKSRVFELLARVIFRPLTTSNITNAALFRSLHSLGGVALIDEAERLRESRSTDVAELLTSLYAGYKRGGSATRCEKVGDRFVQQEYCVFGPKAVACINSIPTTLASRCIPVPMFRSPPGSQKSMLRLGEDEERWRAIRDALHSLAMEHGQDWLVLPSRKDAVPCMSGRDFELWQPLLALAAWLEDHGAENLLSVLQEHAVRSIEEASEARTVPEDEMILRALARLVAAFERPTAADLLREVQAEDLATFRNWSAKGVGARLRRYGFKSRKTAGIHVFTPTVAELLRVQTNYGIDLDLPPPEE